MTTGRDERQTYDLDELRKRLSAQTGKQYWRSLNELAQTEEFQVAARTEFPQKQKRAGALDRRDFLKIMGASLALGGLTACVPQNPEKIVTYSEAPESLLPGSPLYFASAFPRDGFGVGVLVRSEMGRPNKVDGNPRHPVSRGSSDMFMQASLLDMYDPDRAQKITGQGSEKTWGDFSSALAAQTGPNLRILTGVVTSPSLADQINAVLAKFPQGKWHQYSPLHFSRGRLTQVFSQPVDVQYHFDKAKVILALDADFLFREPGSLRYAQDFNSTRIPEGQMSRLYVVESGLTTTGAVADHRLAMRAGDVEAFARSLANKMGISAVSQPGGSIPGKSWLEPLAADLQSAGTAALVVPGDRQPAAVHAIAHAINQALGAVGSTVDFTDPVEANPVDPLASLQDLANDLSIGSVDTLLIFDGNPAYTAPVDLGFGELIQKAKFSAYLGLYADETAALTTWHVPAAHYLEAWGDLRAYEGTTSIIQPLIEPLYGGKTPQEVLAVLLGQSDAKGYDLLRSYWSSQITTGSFDIIWKQALCDGYLPDTALIPLTEMPQINPSVLSSAAQPAEEGALEITFEPDPTLWDGQYANNAWLQELPKILTKLTWDNAALVSPKTAQQMGLNEDDVIEIKVGDNSVEAPVYIQPGQADDSIALSLGYGRTKGGKILQGTGFNAYSLRTAAAPWFVSGVQVTKTGKTYKLVTTRDHQTMEGRELILFASQAEYQKNPSFAQTQAGDLPSLYEPVAYPGHAWGMTINLSNCIGCNACVIACIAENNGATVGKDQVSRSREMHWLRIDRYFIGGLDAPSVGFEPIPCMHCESATCEPVCPVEATSHSSEGINEMTYNRCVGTRYCSNNCPYKVRRFNFYKFQDFTTPSLKAMRNPDVTVRMRGVMEKCTYCIQRINSVKFHAEATATPIQDGDILTACQQACPTHTIVFGDINDANSEVRKLKQSPLNYLLLGELGEKPRTSYLAKVTNPNPQINEQA